MHLRYHDMLRKKLDELRLDVHMFFRIAHFDAFGTNPDLSDDVAQYRLNALIPRYVVVYLDKIQEK